MLGRTQQLDRARERAKAQQEYAAELKRQIDERDALRQRSAKRGWRGQAPSPGEPAARGGGPSPVTAPEVPHHHAHDHARGGPGYGYGAGGGAVAHGGVPGGVMGGVMVPQPALPFGAAPRFAPGSVPYQPSAQPFATGMARAGMMAATPGALGMVGGYAAAGVAPVPSYAGLFGPQGVAPPQQASAGPSAHPTPDPNPHPHSGYDRRAGPPVHGRRAAPQSLSPSRNPTVPTGDGSEDPEWRAREDKRLAYVRELDEQVQLKKQRDEAEKRKKMEREMREERELAAYNPFGRGGGGAPLRDNSGAIISDLRSLKKFGSDNTVSTDRPGYLPDSHDNRTVGVVAANGMRSPQRSAMPPPPIVAMQVATPPPSHVGPPPAPDSVSKASEDDGRFVRFRFSQLPADQQAEIEAKNRRVQQYQEELKAQMEEANRKKEMEKQREKEMDRREEARLAAERKQLAAEGGGSPAPASKTDSGVTEQKTEARSGVGTPARGHPGQLPSGPPSRSPSRRDIDASRRDSRADSVSALSIHADMISRRRRMPSTIEEHESLPPSRGSIATRDGGRRSRRPSAGHYTRIQSELLKQQDAIRQQLRDQEMLMKQLQNEVQAARYERGALASMRAAIGSTDGPPAVSPTSPTKQAAPAMSSAKPVASYFATPGPGTNSGKPPMAPTTAGKSMVGASQFMTPSAAWPQPGVATSGVTGLEGSLRGSSEFVTVASTRKPDPYATPGPMQGHRRVVSEADLHTGPQQRSHRRSDAGVSGGMEVVGGHTRSASTQALTSQQNAQELSRAAAQAPHTVDEPASIKQRPWSPVQTTAVATNVSHTTTTKTTTSTAGPAASNSELTVLLRNLSHPGTGVDGSASALSSARRHEASEALLTDFAKGGLNSIANVPKVDVKVTSHRTTVATSSSANQGASDLFGTPGTDDELDGLLKDFMGKKSKWADDAS